MKKIDTACDILTVMMHLHVIYSSKLQFACKFLQNGSGTVQSHTLGTGVCLCTCHSSTFIVLTKPQTINLVNRHSFAGLETNGSQLATG